MKKSTNKQQRSEALPASIRRHLRFGFWSLLAFLSLGIALEAMHGFKAGFYLDLANETRRHMWTLAHAHGTLLALVHIAFAAALGHVSHREQVERFCSPALMGASLLIPGGFFLGGTFVYAGDPGLGILLVPVGAALLLASVFGVARRL
jgi:hypothetical protein